MRLTRRLLVLAGLFLPSAAAAQGLRDKVFDLFRFGDCAQPLCLPSLVNQGNVHGNHFVPAALASGGLVLEFLSSAVGSALSNLPHSATSGGTTFSFVGGAPVKTTLSAGPIFAERAHSLGRGRTLIGANVSAIRFRTIRGVPLNDLRFNVTHENALVPNVMGDPLHENDVLAVRADIELDAYVTSAFVTYGLTDRVDLGLTVPFVVSTLRGRSVGEIVPFDGVPVHYFGGDDQNPQLSATGTTSGSAAGLGDIAARVKVNLVANEAASGMALLGEVRLPTGKEEDLQGSGDFSARFFGVWSGRSGNFSPHVNFGWVTRQSSTQNNSVIVTAGFDQLLTPTLTFAAEMISEWQMGHSLLELPEPVTFTSPYVRTIAPTNVPDIKDNQFNASLGGKYTTSKGLSFVANALIPLNRGGLRPWSIVTAGLEYTF